MLRDAVCSPTLLLELTSQWLRSTPWHRPMISRQAGSADTTESEAYEVTTGGHLEDLDSDSGGGEEGGHLGDLYLGPDS